MKITQKEQTLFETFQLYGQNAKKWMRKCVLLLPQIEKHQIWRKKGFSSIYEFAAKLARMNQNKVDKSLYILNKLKDKPALKKIAEKKALTQLNR